eukprot:6210053-Pleurochrysis_carterae.AAC.2
MDPQRPGEARLPRRPLLGGGGKEGVSSRTFSEAQPDVYIVETYYFSVLAWWRAGSKINTDAVVPEDNRKEPPIDVTYDERTMAVRMMIRSVDTDAWISLRSEYSTNATTASGT